MVAVRKGSLGTKGSFKASPPNTVSGGDKGSKATHGTRFNKHKDNKRGA